MRPLVIGIDARELTGARTGVGTYLGELLARWTRRPDAAARHLVLYTPRPIDIGLAGLDVRVLPGDGGTWWEQTTLSGAVRRDGPHVFFAPAYTAPISLPCPLVVTIHDVSFSRHPEWFRPREGLRRRWLTRHGARRAAVVLTVSRFSAGEIQTLYRVAPERVAVVYNGITRRPGISGIPREPLVLYTGSIFNRRNVPDLIAAFARVVAAVPAARLAIVGADRSWPAQPLDAVAAAHGVRDRVDLKAYVPADELEALYSRASAFAFLSSYEGFGLTPLEALAAGVPTVVADTPVAREIYGEAPAFVGLHDLEGTARALVRLMSDPVARDEQLERARPVLERYSWETAASETLAHLERVASR